MSVRRARTADTAAILSINEGGLPGVSPLQFADIDAMQTAGWIWVAIDVASVAGYLIAVPSGVTPVGDEYRWFATRFANFLYVDQIAVDVPYRRRRIASALYDSIERVAADNGFDRLVCEVNLSPANPSSVCCRRSRPATKAVITEPLFGYRPAPVGANETTISNATFTKTTNGATERGQLSIKKSVASSTSQRF